jgi:hypothetical protein
MCVYTNCIKCIIYCIKCIYKKYSYNITVNDVDDDINNTCECKHNINNNNRFINTVTVITSPWIPEPSVNNNSIYYLLKALESRV